MSKEEQLTEAPLLGKWIHLALAGGPKRKLVVAQDDRFGYVAILEFGDLGTIVGEHASTPDHAAVLLENDLENTSRVWLLNEGDGTYKP